MYLFVNSEDGDELSNALTDRRRMRVKPGVEPSNMRILLADILTFDGLFGAKFDILKPRWLLTPLSDRKPITRPRRDSGFVQSDRC